MSGNCRVILAKTEEAAFSFASISRTGAASIKFSARLAWSFFDQSYKWAIIIVRVQGSRGVSREDESTLVFRKLEESLEKNRGEFVKQNSVLCDVFGRIIGFQYRIQKKVSPKHEKPKDGWTRRGIPDSFLTEMFVFGLLYRNMEYLVAARHILAQRTFHACGSLVRPVVESVPKSFYLMARPQTTRKFILLEKYMTWTNTPPIQNRSVKIFLELPETRKLLNVQQVTVQAFNKFRRDHSAACMRKKIYDGKTLEHQNQLYAELSSNSHSSLSRIGVPRHDPRLSKRFMQIIADLAFINLFLTINSQKRLLDKQDFLESQEFMRKVWKDVGPLSPLFQMYPSKDEYRNNLAITIESLS